MLPRRMAMRVRKKRRARARVLPRRKTVRMRKQAEGLARGGF